jgi:hypothetical protein
LEKPIDTHAVQVPKEEHARYRIHSTSFRLALLEIIKGRARREKRREEKRR